MVRLGLPLAIVVGSQHACFGFVTCPTGSQSPVNSRCVASSRPTFLQMVAKDSIQVTPALIKELRDATGAGMMDCKKALLETDGDIEAASAVLRKKGLAKADKKASRVAAEGKIAFATNGNKAVMVEVNCETDFVAKDASFLEFVDSVTDAALSVDGDNVDALLALDVSGSSIEDKRQALVAKIGENIQVRRVVGRGGEGRTVGAYVHMSRIGVLVELEGGSEELAANVAMHVAAMNPPFALPEEVPADVLEKERAIFKAQALDSGKPADIIDKMVEGRIRKYLEDVCLVSQTYVKTNDKTVGKLLEESGAKLVGFTRIAVGEGIEKKEDDFAAEVAKMAGRKADAAEPVSANPAPDPANEPVSKPKVEVKPAKTEPTNVAQAKAAGDCATVTTALIKELREATGAGMMDCKKALLETDGDMEAASAVLRKKGLAKADKKASRVAAEGKIGFASSGNKAVLVEVNCETDFVAKDASFLEFVDSVTNAALNVEGANVDALLAADLSGSSVEDVRQALVAKIGENIQVRRLAGRGGEGSTVGAYVHMNRIGVLVELEGGSEELAADVAMHVAAMNPPYALAEEVPADVLEKERSILKAQALDSGKPADIVDKMVEGRIRKYLEEMCLVSQTYVKTNDKTVGKLLEENGAKLKGFTRIAVGEGIEKKEDDFAAEVAKMAGGKADAPVEVAPAEPAPEVAPEPKAEAKPAKAEKSSESMSIDDVNEELRSQKAAFDKSMAEANTVAEAEALRREYLGKKGPIGAAMGYMRLLPNEDKPKLGAVVNEIKMEMEDLLQERMEELELSEIEQKMEKERIDVTMPGLTRSVGYGHRHPLSMTMEKAVDIFTRLGYDTVTECKDSPEIERDYYCFEALNCPKDHPARDMQDTFYLREDMELLLRTHTSAVQIRQLEKRKPPLRIVAPGRVFRRDDIDATHSLMFHQVEILAIEEKGELDLGHLKGTVEYFLRHMFGPDIDVRFRGSYFPFTEPSMEVDVFYRGRWLEVLGCGMVDPAVLEMAGLDPAEYSGFAAGFGVERFAMVMHGITDIRDFTKNDARFTEQFPHFYDDGMESFLAGVLAEPEPEDPRGESVPNPPVKSLEELRERGSIADVVATKEEAPKEQEKKNKSPPAPDGEIDISKLDIRVGVITKAWENADADKLFFEEIDIGEESGPRQVASGLKAHYNVDDLVGQRVLVLANLKARKLAGFPSHGMVMCACSEDGSKVEFVEPPADAAIGERITVDGFDGEPATENQVIKKKMLDAIFPELKTNADGVATYKGVPLGTSAGVCKAQNGLPNGNVS